MAIGDEKLRIVASDSIEVLKNLGGVSVVVDVNDYADQEGFTNAVVAKRVSNELKENGVEIISSEASNVTASQAFVYIQVFLIGEQAVINLALNERVLLFRDSKTVVIGAQTYGATYTGPHSNSKLKVWQAITKAVTEFSLRHMYANRLGAK